MQAPLPRRQFLQGSAAAVALLMESTRNARAAEPAPPRVKIGQIGTTHAHASKLEVYRRSPDYEVVGIVEPSSRLVTPSTYYVGSHGRCVFGQVRYPWYGPTFSKRFDPLTQPQTRGTGLAGRVYAPGLI